MNDTSSILTNCPSCNRVHWTGSYCPNPFCDKSDPFAGPKEGVPVNETDVPSSGYHKGDSWKAPKPKRKS